MGSDKHLLIIMVPHTSLILFTLNIIHSHSFRATAPPFGEKKGPKIVDFCQNWRPKVKDLELGRLL